jgi:hypothetical protein
MRPVTILLILYCFAAAAGLGFWAWYSISQAGQLAQQIAAVESRLDQLEGVAEDRLQDLRKLEAAQREGRRNFSGPEAVDASYAVQVAQAQYNDAEGQVAAVGEDLDALERQHEYHSRLVVPLLAGVLLHLLFGIAMIRRGPRSKHAL